jgi:hypothetical protein
MKGVQGSEEIDEDEVEEMVWSAFAPILRLL